MRWIFLTLIVINLIAFAVGMVVAPGSQSQYQAAAGKTHRNPYQNFPSLMLLSEIQSSVASQAGVARIQRGEDVGAGEGGDGAQEPKRERELAAKPDLCEMLGPFKSASAADVFLERLKAIEIKAELKEIELPVGPGYWVYLAPKASRQEALRHLAELQAKKIDSYVIPKGELANGISLGMFSRKSLSDARVREMKSLGLQPKMDQIERSYRELWVMLIRGEDDKMSKYSWERVMDGLNIPERRQNYCLDVAS